MCECVCVTVCVTGRVRVRVWACVREEDHHTKRFQMYTTQIHVHIILIPIYLLPHCQSNYSPFHITVFLITVQILLTYDAVIPIRLLFFTITARHLFSHICYDAVHFLIKATVTAPILHIPNIQCTPISLSSWATIICI